MKKIGTAIYTHYYGVKYLNMECKELYLQAIKMISTVITNKCSIVKIDLKNKKVSFIESENFDTAREPAVGNAYCVDVEKGEYKIIKSKGQIYHHKWMFVPENYPFFDIEESKKWSEKWRSIFPTDKTISSRIGYKKYWDEYLTQFGLEVEK